ncbi:MAG: hypothetical protein WDM80_14235 [Limisphaerales bacterium]
MKSAIIAGIMVVAILLTGCGKKSSSATTLTAQPEIILEPALTAWQSGDKTTATSNFLAMDWNSAPSSAPSSTLSISEVQFKTLSNADRQAKSLKMTAQLQSLRDLASSVEEAGRDAVLKGDMAQARKCFTSLKQCGTALDNPDYLQIVQLTGQAMKKMSDKDMAKIPQ